MSPSPKNHKLRDSLRSLRNLYPWMQDPTVGLAGPLMLALLSVLLQALEILFFMAFLEGAASPKMTSALHDLGLLPFSARGFLIFCGASVFLLATLKGFLTLRFRQWVGRAQLFWEAALRQSVFDTFLSLDRGGLDQTSQAAPYKLVQNCSQVSQVPAVVLNLAQQFLLILLFVTLTFLLSPGCGILAFALTPFYFFVSARIDRRVKKSLQILQRLELRKKDFIFDSIGKLKVVKAYGAEGEEKARFATLLSRTLRVSKISSKLSERAKPLDQLFRFSMLGLVGFISSNAGNLSQPLLLVRSALLIFIFKKIEITVNSTIKLLRNARSLSDPLQNLAQFFSQNPEYQIPDGTSDLLETISKIEVRDLTFRYPAGSPALTQLSATFLKGDLVGITGPSGSGKSTLARLLLRLYGVSSDSIFINGVDICTFKAGSLRGHFHLVTTESTLLEASLRSNICVNPKLPLSDQRIDEVLTLIGLRDRIDQLPHGLDTPVVGNSLKFSGGEYQKLAIARAILCETDVLILDEAMNGMDSHSQRQVFEALRATRAGRITLLISHHQTVLNQTDRILHFSGGRLLEEEALHAS